MRILNVLCLALLAALTPIASVSAKPSNEMAKVQAAMGRVHSYKSVVTWSAGSRSATAQIEAVNPDRFRSISYGGALQFIVIGKQYWVRTSRQPWTRLKNPPVMSMIGNVEAVMHFNDPSKYSVRDLGMRNGYHALSVVERTGKSRNVVYLRPDHLVAHVDMQVGNEHGTTTYGQYNAPVSIQPPGR